MKKTIVTVTDDLTGEEGAREFKFSIEGVHYSIDLSETSRTDVLSMLAPLIGAARRDTGKRRVSTGVVNRRTDAPVIRSWAKSNGLMSADRGRIAAAIIAAYENRNATSVPDFTIDLSVPATQDVAVEVL